MDATHTIVTNPGPADRVDCRALADTLASVGDKWTVAVVGVLRRGPLRYKALQREVQGISPRMLTLTLKGLERDGLITRTVYPTIPPRVDYALSALGQTLIAPLMVWNDWTQRHRAAVELARQQFDAA